MTHFCSSKKSQRRRAGREGQGSHGEDDIDHSQGVRSGPAGERIDNAALRPALVLEW